MKKKRKKEKKKKKRKERKNTVAKAFPLATIESNNFCLSSDSFFI